MKCKSITGLVIGMVVAVVLVVCVGVLIICIVRRYDILTTFKTSNVSVESKTSLLLSNIIEHCNM